MGSNLSEDIHLVGWGDGSGVKLLYKLMREPLQGVVGGGGGVREKTARGVWESPEQREEVRGILNMTSRLDLTVRDGEE